MSRVLITGGETGLGLELTRAYSAAGDIVSVICRESSAELDALAPHVNYAKADVRDPGVIDQVAKEIGHTPIDILINNAGIMIKDDINKIDLAALRLQFEVNALGPLNIVLAFQQLLHTGSRVINISSRLGSIDDNETGDDYGYRMSKAAQNMLTSNLSIQLRKKGVCVVALHPGIVATGMTGGFGTPAAKVANDLKITIEGLDERFTGKFFDRFGKEIPW
ncbi:MAG: C-factor [Alphaproteobacteria bacterium MarineAlpha11_Bin1]|nr:MAG: C-factor [Alphaproteobacteria bacterium MarineAlpha11_Bin1]|tara:strand:+ start:4016 stop:4678 length:663 start_codon:yes stop_codon:yes gene_type:complete